MEASKSYQYKSTLLELAQFLIFLIISFISTKELESNIFLMLEELSMTIPIFCFLEIDSEFLNISFWIKGIIRIKIENLNKIIYKRCIYFSFEKLFQDI